MPLRTALLLLALAVSGCSAQEPPAPQQQSSGFSTEVRENFLTSCVDNAAATSGRSADDEELAATCDCILAKVESEYDEAAFQEFEQRLVDGSASESESRRLEQWSTTCAEESAR